MSPILGARGGLSASAYGFTSAVAAPTDYESIATTTVGAGGVGSITFSSIPSTYSHLQVRYMTLTNTTSAPTTLQFNSDTTGSNYRYHILFGSSGGAAAGSGTTAYAPVFQGGSIYPGVGVLDILDYANTNKYTTVRNLDGYDTNGTGAAIGAIGLTSDLWVNTAAITSITFVANTTFNQYTQFALYGIK
jgi:hypothetical protein